MTICSFVLVIACTRTIRIRLRDRYKNRILVFGIGENAREVERVINGNRFSMMEVEAFLNCNESEKITHKQDALINESRMISILKVKEYMQEHEIDSCIFTIPGLSKKEMK